MEEANRLANEKVEAQLRQVESDITSGPKDMEFAMVIDGKVRRDVYPPGLEVSVGIAVACPDDAQGLLIIH